MNEENSMPATDASLPQPWWRFGIVWLALALPALVVVAGLCTAAIAWRHADALVVDAPVGHARTAQAPAVQARNHVATPLRGAR
jgi:uncharacterized protein